MAFDLAESTHMYINAALTIWAFAVVRVVQDAVLRAWLFGWRWPCISKINLCEPGGNDRSGTGKKGRRVGCCGKDGWGWASTGDVVNFGQS